MKEKIKDMFDRLFGDLYDAVEDDDYDTRTRQVQGIESLYRKEIQNLTKHNNDLTKICFNYACEDLDQSKDRCKREEVCDMQIRKSSLES